MIQDYLKENAEFDSRNIEIGENIIVSQFDMDALEANPAWRKLLQIFRGEEIETFGYLKASTTPGHLLRVAQGKCEGIELLWESIGTLRQECQANAFLESETEEQED